MLVTGGAGFIGTHLTNGLVDDGHDVRVLDSFDAQVHDGGAPPFPLDDRVDVVRGDVRDGATVRKALEGVDVVYHFAAAVGVGQSMYEIERYMATNSAGTATLLEEVAKRPIERFVVASSMSVYGEGLYVDADGHVVAEAKRDPARVRAGDFETRGPDGLPLTPIPTPETKIPDLASVYALSKYDQERLSLIVGAAYGIPTVALRFFNVYGPGQTLGNPYTGVMAIFGTRILNGRPPLVFEDGRQQRDFVHVTDIVRACRLALWSEEAVGHTVNVGTGRPVTIAGLGEAIARHMGREDLVPEITNKARAGDVRHCFADIQRAKDMLDYEPRMTLEAGMRTLVTWLAESHAADRTDEHRADLEARGLIA